MQKTYTVNLDGYIQELPVLEIAPNLGIAFFNLHGNTQMTEHCGKALAKKLQGCDILITAESKGLQLTHVVAREMGHPYYAVVRKSKKLYMQDGIEVAIESSITTGKPQYLYLSKHDVDLIKGKKVGIVDDVVSTGASLKGLCEIVKKAGGIVYRQAFCLAEADAKNMKDIIYLDTIPLFKD